MYDFNDRFIEYSFCDYLSLAYFYAEIVLVDFYVTSIDGQTGTFSQKHYNRMVLNACLARLLGGIK